MSRQAEICHAVAATLREAFSGQLGVDVAVEDACNPSEEVEKSLGRFGVLVLVAASGHRRRPGGGASADGDVALDLTIVENPRHNRKSGTQGPTITSAAEAAVEALHWRETCGMRLNYLEMQRADVDPQDLRMVVRFEAQPSTGGLESAAPADGPEPEEIIEARLVELLKAALPGWSVAGALAVASEGEMKELPDTRVTVAVDIASQDLDWRGPGVPCTYAARVVVRVANADDPSGRIFRDACRAVRAALASLLGDRCAMLDADGFKCDSFVFSSTSTVPGDTGAEKTYNAAAAGRHNP